VSSHVYANTTNILLGNKCQRKTLDKKTIHKNDYNVLKTKQRFEILRGRDES